MMNSPAPPMKPISSKSGQSRSTPAERLTSSKGKRRAGRQGRERSRSLTARPPRPNRARARRRDSLRTNPRSRTGSRLPCPALSSRCWRRCRSLRPPETDGCMRSSSTATGFKRISKTARLRSGPGAASIDGELVVENESGVAEFSLLQADLSDGRLDRFAYYAFDCLYLDGRDLREAAL